MSRSHAQASPPVAVDLPHPDTDPPGTPARPDSPGPAAVSVLIVTWNRWEMADRVLGAIARQSHSPAALHVVIIDNASTDGTTDQLTARWNPERIVENPTDDALTPRFQPGAADARTDSSPAPREPNSAGFGSFTIIRNSENLGGCGGFNTGLAWTRFRAQTDPDFNPSFAWLVDDDTDLPTDALANLVAAAESDPELGLVGSRTCDIDHRARTIETTVYLNPDTGLMADEPSPAHPLHNSHQDWARSVGGTRNGSGYTGLRPVDVVSACSLLARWSAVREVGLWDARFFIYCDDADWSLRFARAGYKVALNLDAVVYHTPWHHKLTLARLYYAQRNLLWMLRKSLPASRVRPVLRRRMLGLLRESLKAALMRRLTHAELIRRSVADALANIHGKLAFTSPPTRPLADALAELGPRAHIALICNRPACHAWADRLKRACAEAAAAAGTHPPQWTRFVRNDCDQSPRDDENTIVYSLRRRSRLRRQLGMWLRPPAAAVVFDNGNDLPLFTGKRTLHADPKDLSRVMVEPNRLRDRARFLTRWVGTALKTLTYLVRTPAFAVRHEPIFEHAQTDAVTPRRAAASGASKG